MAPGPNRAAVLKARRAADISPSCLNELLPASQQPVSSQSAASQQPVSSSASPSPHVDVSLGILGSQSHCHCVCTQGCLLSTPMVRASLRIEILPCAPLCHWHRRELNLHPHVTLPQTPSHTRTEVVVSVAVNRIVLGSAPWTSSTSQARQHIALTVLHSCLLAVSHLQQHIAAVVVCVPSPWLHSARPPVSGDCPSWVAALLMDRTNLDPSNGLSGRCLSR